MLPVIDLSRFADGTPPERQSIAERLGEACETIGFFYVANHGVPQVVIDDALAAATAFFGQARQVKLRYARRPGQYRGLIPLTDFTTPAAGRPPIRYEAFLVGAEVAADDPAIARTRGLLVPNVWPESPAGFRAAVTAYRDAVQRAGGEVLAAFGIALGVAAPDGRGCRPLERFFTKPLSNLSLLHYPARPESTNPGPDDARAHYDTNVLTVLLPSPVGGLEALRPDGTWMEVPPLEGCFVVNIGNMMACWSGGRFKSTMHRVHPPIGVERYSIGYFLVPDYETVVAPLNPNAVADPALCEPVHAGGDLARFVASCDAMVAADD